MSVVQSPTISKQPISRKGLAWSQEDQEQEQYQMGLREYRLFMLNTLLSTIKSLLMLRVESVSLRGLGLDFGFQMVRVRLFSIDTVCLILKSMSTTGRALISLPSILEDLDLIMQVLLIEDRLNLFLRDSGFKDGAVRWGASTSALGVVFQGDIPSRGQLISISRLFRGPLLIIINSHKRLLNIFISQVMCQNHFFSSFFFSLASSSSYQSIFQNSLMKSPCFYPKPPEGWSFLGYSFPFSYSYFFFCYSSAWTLAYSCRLNSIALLYISASQSYYCWADFFQAGTQVLGWASLAFFMNSSYSFRLASRTIANYGSMFGSILSSLFPAPPAGTLGTTFYPARSTKILELVMASLMWMCVGTHKTKDSVLFNPSMTASTLFLCPANSGRVQSPQTMRSRLTASFFSCFPSQSRSSSLSLIVEVMRQMILCL